MAEGKAKMYITLIPRPFGDASSNRRSMSLVRLYAARLRAGRGTISYMLYSKNTIIRKSFNKNTNIYHLLNNLLQFTKSTLHKRFTKISVHKTNPKELIFLD